MRFNTVSDAPLTTLCRVLDKTGFKWKAIGLNKDLC